MSEEIINSHAASENIFAPKLSFMTKKFEEKHLNKAKYQLVKKKGVTFLLLMLLDTWAKDVNTYLIPSDCLFGAVKLTRNADPNKDWYSSYGIGFDARSDVSLSNGKKVAVFGVGNS